MGCVGCPRASRQLQLGQRKHMRIPRSSANTKRTMHWKAMSTAQGSRTEVCRRVSYSGTGTMTQTLGTCFPESGPAPGSCCRYRESRKHKALCRVVGDKVKMGSPSSTRAPKRKRPIRRRTSTVPGKVICVCRMSRSSWASGAVRPSANHSLRASKFIGFSVLLAVKYLPLAFCNFWYKALAASTHSCAGVAWMKSVLGFQARHKGVWQTECHLKVNRRRPETRSQEFRMELSTRRAKDRRCGIGPSTAASAVRRGRSLFGKSGPPTGDGKLNGKAHARYWACHWSQNSVPVWMVTLGVTWARRVTSWVVVSPAWLLV